MAFKMKGSAFKLGNVATKSALKHGVPKIPKSASPEAIEGNRKERRTHAQWHTDNPEMNKNHEAKSPIKDSGKAGFDAKQLADNPGFAKVAEKHDKLHADWAKNPGKGTAPHAEMEEKSPAEMRSPMKQLPLYTCPECGAEFELPEELAAHFEDHLSGGPGGGNYPDQDDFFIDTEGGEDTPTTTTTTGRFRDE